MNTDMTAIESAHKLYVWRAERMLMVPSLRDEARATEAKCVALLDDPPALLAAYAAVTSRYSDLEGAGTFDAWMIDDLNDENGLASVLFAASRGMRRLDAVFEDAWTLASDEEQAQFVVRAATMIGGAQ